jgi:hypothetical protein
MQGSTTERTTNGFVVTHPLDPGVLVCATRPSTLPDALLYQERRNFWRPVACRGAAARNDLRCGGNETAFNAPMSFQRKGESQCD